jgi:putative transposase
MKWDLKIGALELAVAVHQPSKGCIYHPDRGSQYCSNDCQKLLKKHCFEVSMNAEGICSDNSMGKMFFKSIKTELTLA